MADNLELAEEQLWTLFAGYYNLAWTGEIDYPGSFNIRDTNDEITQLAQAAATQPADPRVKRAIDVKILDWLDLDEDELAALVDPTIVDLASVPEDVVIEDIAATAQPGPTGSPEACPIATQDIGVNLANRQTAIDTARYGPLNPALPNRTFWLAKADMWNTDVDTAKSSVCGNCSFFVQTQPILDCIEAGLAAGGATGDEWDSVGGGQLGYCEAFDFKCKSTRTCDAWVAGGPVTDGDDEHPSLADLSQADRLLHIQDMLMEGYSNDEILALHPELVLQDIIDAGAEAARNN